MAFNYLSRNLSVERLPKKGFRKITEDVVYDNGRVTVSVPKGYITDFASIPSLFKVIVNNDDWRVVRPAISHDYMYETHQVVGGFISRKQADDLFYEMLRVEGMGWFKAKLMWAGVRIGGFIAWDNE